MTTETTAPPARTRKPAPDPAAPTDAERLAALLAALDEVLADFAYADQRFAVSRLSRAVAPFRLSAAFAAADQ